MAIDTSAPVITRDWIELDAPVERVWAIQTDVDHWVDWRPTVSRATLTGPLEAGSSFEWTEANLDIVSTISLVEAPHRIEWGGPAHGIDGLHVWILSPTDSGTLIRTEESWSGEPITANVDAMQAALDGSLREWLRRLKDRVES